MEQRVLSPEPSEIQGRNFHSADGLLGFHLLTFGPALTPFPPCLDEIRGRRIPEHPAQIRRRSRAADLQPSVRQWCWT